MGGNDQRAALAVGAVTGVGLALEGLQPTGSVVVDWLLLIVAGTAAVWAAASAPWWALSALAGVAAAISPPVVPMAIGLVVFGFSLAVGALRRTQPVERAIIAGGAMLVLSLARELRWFGVNTLIALALVIGVAALGVWRRSDRRRRLAGQVLGGVAAFITIACLGLLMAAISARGDLSEGNRVARQGLSELKSGEFELARQSFGRAADAFARADTDMSAVWTQPSRLIPVANQHRKVGADLSATAAEATRVIAEQLRSVDLDALRIVDGAIDIEAVKALEAPLIEIQQAVTELDQAVASSNSGWLAGPVERRVVDLADELDDQLALGDKSLEALRMAPAMLGEGGERVYFVMFATPAEARGQGGFMGNYAELTVTNGKIEMTEFGRHTDLNQAGDRPRKLVDAPADWLARYGSFGFQKGPDRVVGEVPWSNITMSPNFPSTAQVVAELYPQSGGRHIDGVISLDVFALEQLVGLVGPLEIDGVTAPLDAVNTAQFLLFDQYDITDLAQRTDMLEQVAKDTFDRLLGPNTPDPLDLGRALAPMAQQRRLLAWANDENEQAVIAAAGMDGTLLGDLNGADGLAVAVVNASGNKIDSFLEPAYTYDVTVDEIGTIQSSLTLRFENQAPETGYPRYVIGNIVGLPDGWSRIYVTVNTPLALEASTVDGEALAVSPSRENGVWTYSTYLDLSPGGATEVTFNLSGTTSGSSYNLVIEPQPLVRNATWNIRARTPTDDVQRAEQLVSRMELDGLRMSGSIVSGTVR